MNYLQQETLALLKHEERLAEAAHYQLTKHVPQEHSLPLAAWFQRFGEQGRKWFAPRRPSVPVEQVC